MVKRYRRQGVGSALLEAAEQLLAKQGFDEVLLNHLARNGDASKLYTARGYLPGQVVVVKRLQPSSSRERDVDASDITPKTPSRAKTLANRERIRRETDRILRRSYDRARKRRRPYVRLTAESLTTIIALGPPCG